MSPESEGSVPAALAARMQKLVDEYGHPGTTTADALLESAIAALRELVRREGTAHSALDLLAIDGLITGAFAGAASCDRLVQMAERARAELFALGSEPTR